MNREGDRPARPEAGGERHAVSITRMCLRSGSVQLPFALAGRLPQGELLVHDSERDEAIVLWSDPPRTLSGLGPLFETHELQVNDQLVLELQGHDLRLGIRKRPRRSRPQVTPSTWESHRLPDGPAGDEDPEGAGATAAAGGPPAFDAEGEGAAWPAEDDGYGPEGGSRGYDRDADDEGGGPDPYAADAYPADPYDHDPYDDAPHAPRVRVSPLPNDRAGVREAGRRASAPAEPRGRADEGAAGGWLGGVWRTARSWLGGGERRVDADAPPAAPERDWTDAWDDAKPATSADPLVRNDAGHDVSTPGTGRGRDDDRGADDGYVFEYDEGAFDDAPAPSGRRAGPRGGGPGREASPRTERPRPDRRDDDARRSDALDAGGPAPDARRREPSPPAPRRPDLGGPYDEARDDDAPDVDARERGGRDVSERGPEAPGGGQGARAGEGAEAADLLDVDAVDGAADARDAGATAERAGERSAPPPAATEPGAGSVDAAPPADGGDRPDDPAARAAAWRPERGVPSRAERFLAGDLRTRLLRFLTSPDMPLIAKSEMIASRFDLDEETARDMLADIAEDPPPGIRLTPVREGAWRIERSGRA